MKKNFLYLFCLLFVLIIPLTFISAFSDANASVVDPALREYLGDNYREKIIKNSLSAKKINDIELLISKSKFTKDNYPTFIGGLYIDDSDNNVVIQLVKNNITTFNSKYSDEYELYSKILDIGSDAKIEYVNYSYNDINNVINVLENYYSNNYEDGLIDGYYDDIINNRVVVELKNYSEDVISDFKKYISDSDLIYFTQSKATVNYMTTYLPG